MIAVPDGTGLMAPSNHLMIARLRTDPTPGTSGEVHARTVAERAHPEPQIDVRDATRQGREDRACKRNTCLCGSCG